MAKDDNSDVEVLELDVGEEDGKTSTVLPTVFISYRWNETKNNVREIVADLKGLGKYDVWIDTEEMYGDKNERMEEGIRKASVVVIFFSDDYQKSRDCRKEAESADRNGKPIVFVKMQRQRCEMQAWFAPIIGSAIFIDYYKFPDPSAEIGKHIDRFLNNTSNLNSNMNTSYLQAKKKFVSIKVPKFAKYQNRTDEVKICNAILEISTNSDFDKEGALVICGGGGSGKTTLVSQLIHSNEEFLLSSCGVDIVIWLNCFKWTGDGFDEADFERSLIDLAEKAADYSGFNSLKDVVDFFEKTRQLVLIVLDDIFNVQVLESLREHWPGVKCIAVTRDVDELTTRHGLVSKVHRLQELDEEEIIAMFESAYRLKGKLTREQLATLAKQCCSLPIVVSLIAAHFQDCETLRDFAAEYEMVLEEVKVKDLKIVGPYGTVSKLFEFSIEQLDESLRKLFYAFLLFNPAEAVNVEDLAILWRFSNPHRALVRCRQIAKKSLARPVIGSQSAEDGGLDNQHLVKESDLFLVHQILHEAAVDNATKTHRLGTDLDDLRTQIITGFSEEENGFELLVKTVVNQRLHLLKTIFENVKISVLVKIAKMSGDKLTGGLSFLHFLYNSSWPENGSDSLSGANNSMRLLRLFFGRVLRYNKSTKATNKIDIPELLAAPSREGEKSCLLIQLFMEEPKLRRHKFDRVKLVKFLTPIDGTYKKFKQLEFLTSITDSDGDKIFIATGRGDFETVRSLVTKTPQLVMLRTEKQETPMIAAALLGHVEIVKFLYEANPSHEHVNANDVKDKTAFTIACQYGNLEIVKFLYEQLTEKEMLLTKWDKKKRTPMILAAMNGAVSVIEFLYNINNNLVNDREKFNRSPLLQAARFGHFEAVKYLMETCGCVHDENTDSRNVTPLMFAAANGSLEMVKFICSYKDVDINRIDFRQETAFFNAAHKGQLAVVKFLFDKDNEAALEKRQKAGRTALMMACLRNEYEVVAFLCDKYRRARTSTNDGRFYTDKQGDTALIIAASYGHLASVKAFCQGYDADGEESTQAFIEAVKMRNSHYKTALDQAKKYRHQQVIDYLIKTFYVNETDQ